MMEAMPYHRYNSVLANPFFFEAKHIIPIYGFIIKFVGV